MSFDYFRDITGAISKMTIDVHVFVFIIVHKTGYITKTIGIISHLYCMVKSDKISQTFDIQASL